MPMHRIVVDHKLKVAIDTLIMYLQLYCTVCMHVKTDCTMCIICMFLFTCTMSGFYIIEPKG